MSSDAANKSVLSVHDPTYPVREAQVSSNLRRWCPSFSASNKIASIFLFCFPFAGGAASAFGNWAANFADNITICPVQYPGRETRWSDPGFEQLSALVDTLADDFADRWPSRFAFLGHSFGALVAYELARTLTQRGHPTPLRLFLSGARAPHLPPKEKVHHLSDQEFLTKLRQYNGVPDELLDHHDFMAVVLPTIKHDFQLFEEHCFQNGNPLAIPLSVFGGLQDSNVSIADLLGWSAQTNKAFRCRFLKGHHFFLFDSLPDIAAYVKEDLDACFT